MKNLIDRVTEFEKDSDLNLLRYTVMDRDGNAETKEFAHVCRCQNLYSIAKAFVVTAVGILRDDGLLDTDETLGDIFVHGEIPDDVDPLWRGVTVDQLLLHRGGYPSGYLDIDTIPIYKFGTADFLEYLFRTKPAYVPGEESRYSDAAFYMLSRVVEARAGEAIDNFLWRRLFLPLDISEMAWSKCPMGHPMGATGLYLNSEDTAKLGCLYLRGGDWKGRRIFSEEWADITLSRGYELKPVGYGSAYGKGGMYSQMLLVVPEYDRIVCYQSFTEDGDRKLLELSCEA